MKYCNNCGKQLEDNEVCTCQNTNEAQTGASEAAASQSGTFNAADLQQAAKDLFNKEQATVLSMNLFKYVLDFIKSPVACAENVVNEKNVILTGSLMAVNAVLAILVRILIRVIYMFKYDSSYKFTSYITLMVEKVVWWVVIPVVFAAVLMLIAKYIHKKEVDIKAAYCAFTVPGLFAVASLVISLLSTILSHEFFSVIFNAVSVALTTLMYFLTIKSVLKLLPNDKNLIYSIPALCTAMYLANWLVVSVIF